MLGRKEQGAAMPSKLLILAAALLTSGLAAQEVVPLQLAMPDATVIVGMDLDRVKLAVAGSPYERIITPEYRAQYEQSWESMKSMLGYDLSEVKEVVISLRPGAKPNGTRGLVIVRGPFDPDHPPGLLALLPMRQSTYEGVPLLVSAPEKGDPAAFAFLDRSGALFGDPASVRAAILRWKVGAGVHSPLLAKAEGLSRKYHFWCVARGLNSAMHRGAALPKAGQPFEGVLQSIEEVTFGMVVAPAFQASADLLARTEKDAAALRGAAGAAVASALAQAPQEEARDLLSNLKITSQARTVRLSIEIPEQKMVEILQEQMRLAANKWGRPQAPRNTDVVIQGGAASATAAPAPKDAGDTQVITLPGPK
jgi:hypothetical protein